MTNRHDDLIAEAMAATQDPAPTQDGRAPGSPIDGGPGGVPPVEEHRDGDPAPARARWRDGAWCVLLAVLAAGSALVVHEVVPNDVENLGSFLFALVPFVLAAEAVAVFPRSWARIWFVPGLLATLAFAVMMGIFAPTMFGRFVEEDFDGFYALMRIVMPFFILTVVMALRLGGGSGGQVRRTAYASLLVMLSGLEDLMFQVWAGNPIPDQWDWAEHMTVRLGHVASQTEAFVFIGVHLVVALLVLLVPLPGHRRRQQQALD